MSTYEEFLETSFESKVKLRQEELILAVSEGIVKLFQERGLTKKQVAELSGISERNLLSALTGTRNLSLRLIARICVALDVTPQFSIRR